MTVFFKVLGSFFSVEFLLSVTFESPERPTAKVDRALPRAPWRTLGSMCIWCRHLSPWLCSPSGLQTPWDQGSIKTDHCWAFNEHSSKNQIPVCRVTYLKDPNPQYKLTTLTYGHAWPWDHHRWTDVHQNSECSPWCFWCSPAEYFSKFCEQTHCFRSTQYHSTPIKLAQIYPGLST